jgi:hypothetical protein
LTRMTATFRPEYSLHISFKADEWNIVLGKVHVQLQESLAVFLDFVMEEHPSIGV